jgi:sulfate adenylyltransferase
MVVQVIESSLHSDYPAHGGSLVSIGPVKDKYVNHSMDIDFGTVLNIMNMKAGILSPLKGFMDEADFYSVLEDQRLYNGVPWSMPYILDISSKDYATIKPGDSVGLYYRSELIAVIIAKGIFRYNKKDLCRKVFGTTSTEHPGVKRSMERSGISLAGDIIAANIPDIPFMDETLFPAQTREIFKERGWKKITGFQTRNVPHRGHESMQRSALRVSDGIFINPVIGKKKPGDYADNVILDSYRTLINSYYPAGRVLLSPLHYEMSYGGPREAMIHAIMRKNFGCTHFVVGRDHAGVGDFYGPYDAQKNLESFELGIEIMKMDEVFYCKKCEELATVKDCPHGEYERIHFSGTMIRNTMRNELIPESYIFRKEVYDSIRIHDNRFQ